MNTTTNNEGTPVGNDKTNIFLRIPLKIYSFKLEKISYGHTNVC